MQYVYCVNNLPGKVGEFETAVIYENTGKLTRSHGNVGGKNFFIEKLISHLWQHQPTVIFPWLAVFSMIVLIAYFSSAPHCIIIVLLLLYFVALLLP